MRLFLVVFGLVCNLVGAVAVTTFLWNRQYFAASVVGFFTIASVVTFRIGARRRARGEE